MTRPQYIFSQTAMLVALSVLSGAAAASTRLAPDWVKQIPPGTWAEVSLNTLADVNPARDPEVNPNLPYSPPWLDNQPAVLEAWNGGAFAAGYGVSGALIVFGGGHAAYYGNEVYAFDLDSRRWQRLTNPYPNPKFPVDEGIWPDGTPSVPHTYDQIDYHEATNSLVVMRTEYDNVGWTSSPVVAMFSFDNLRPPTSNPNRDLNKLNWRRSSLNAGNYTNVGGWSVYDSSRDVFWANGGAGTNSFVKFDPKSAQSDGRFGSFENFAPRSGVTHAVAAYDPTNDTIVFTTFRLAPEVWAIDLARPGAGSSANVKLSQRGTPPPLEESHGWEWSPARRAFLYYRRGAGVFEFKQHGTSWQTDAWQWSELTSPQNVIVPVEQRVNGTHGVFSKFRIASFMDAEIALVVTRVDKPVYAFRIPEAQTNRVPRQPTQLEAR